MDGVTPTQTQEAAAARSIDYRGRYAEALPHVWRYLIRATGGDRVLSEDLAQEVFLRSAREFKAGKAEALDVPWLMTVARHCLVDHARRQARDARNLALAGNEGVVDAQISDSESALTRAEAVAVLRSLPVMQRTALALHHLDDLPVAQVAAELGKSVSATESLLARARAAFRSQISEADHAE